MYCHQTVSSSDLWPTDAMISPLCNTACRSSNLATAVSAMSKAALTVAYLSWTGWRAFRWLPSDLSVVSSSWINMKRQLVSTVSWSRLLSPSCRRDVITPSGPPSSHPSPFYFSASLLGAGERCMPCQVERLVTSSVFVAIHSGPERH